jgi:hypothetical protein
MDDAFLVGGSQTVRDSNRNLNGVAFRDHSRVQSRAQRGALQQLRHDER